MFAQILTIWPCDFVWLIFKGGFQSCTMNSHTHAHRISFQEKMQVVHQFMSSHNLGKGLLERVDHYFTLLWGQFK